MRRSGSKLDLTPLGPPDSYPILILLNILMQSIGHPMSCMLRSGRTTCCNLNCQTTGLRIVGVGRREEGTRPGWV